MFKYFSKSDNLIDVFVYIKSFSGPKIIISDLDFLSNKEHVTPIKEIITDPLTIDFFVIDINIDIIDLQDQLNNMIDTIYSQDVTNSSFFVNNSIPITKVNNTIIVRDSALKNDFIYSLINDKFYQTSFNSMPIFFLLFSSIPSIIDFIYQFNNFKNVYFILKPNNVYSIPKILALESFIEILLK